MENNHGMLFIFEVEGNYPFWMKNTLIPLDMIWINKELEVVHIAKDVQPCKTISCPSTNPQANALYVFEINAGLAEQSNIEVGSKVTFFRVPSPSQR